MQAPATKGAKGVSAAAMLLCIGAFALPAEAKTWTVKITAMQFDPAIVTVASGDTVVWVNEDPFQHTVTSRDGQRFDSHAIAPGASWRYEAKTPGRYPYVCTFHPTMKAMLIVKSTKSLKRTEGNAP